MEWHNIARTRGNLKFITPDNLEEIFNILGLSPVERKTVVICAALPVREADIQHISGESRAKVRAAIRNLERRGILRRAEALELLAPSTQHWISNLKNSISTLKTLSNS